MKKKEKEKKEKKKQQCTLSTKMLVTLFQLGVVFGKGSLAK